MRVEVAEEGRRGGSGVSGEHVIEGREVFFLKWIDELILEGSKDVTIFVVLSTQFNVLAEERLLVEGGCPWQDVGCVTGVGQTDEWVSVEKGVLSCLQDNPEVAVLALAVRTLDQRCVSGEEMMRVSYGAVDRFNRLLGEVWGRELVGNGVNRLGMSHI